MPSILFQYRIFPVRSFRRILIACGIFVLLFETASSLVLVVPCTPVHNFWNIYLNPNAAGPSHCINYLKFLLVNGAINTVTDFALLVLVSNVLLMAYFGILTEVKASTNALAFASKPPSEIYPDWHLRHWFNVSAGFLFFVRIPWD